MELKPAFWRVLGFTTQPIWDLGHRFGMLDSMSGKDTVHYHSNYHKKGLLGRSEGITLKFAPTSSILCLLKYSFLFKPSHKKESMARLKREEKMEKWQDLPERITIERIMMEPNPNKKWIGKNAERRLQWHRSIIKSWIMARNTRQWLNPVWYFSKKAYTGQPKLISN